MARLEHEIIAKTSGDLINYTRSNNAWHSVKGEAKPFKKIGRKTNPLGKLCMAQCSLISYELLIFLLFQTPVYIIAFFYRLYSAIVNTTYYHRPPTKQDVLDLVFNTSLILFLERCGTNKYILDCGSAFGDRKLLAEVKSIKLILEMPNGRNDVHAAAITQFFINEIETEDAQSMMSAVMLFVTGFSHPKMHSVAEALRLKIQSNSIIELQPSTHVTRALHWMLLSSWASICVFPIYRYPVSKEQLKESAQNWEGFHHTGVFLFKENPFCQFLWKARASCFKHLQNTGLDPMYREYFFLQTIFHSVDHYNVAKFSEFKFGFTPDKQGWWSCFTSAMLRYEFIRPTLNPFWSNLLRSFDPDSIYGKIYSDLVLVNKELADVTTASIMY